MSPSGASTFDVDTYDQTFQGLIHSSENLSRTMTIMGAGSLTIEAQQDTQLGPGGALAGARNFTADFSGLENFVWNGADRVFRVGLRAGTTNTFSGNTGTFVTELSKENRLLIWVSMPLPLLRLSI